MTTVLAVYNSNGCVGRCDANCHDAKHKDCHCICLGKNHGVGFQCASTNVSDGAVGLTRKELREFALATKRNADDLIVIDRVRAPNARRARRLAHRHLTEPEFDWGEKTP